MDTDTKLTSTGKLSLLLESWIVDRLIVHLGAVLRGTGWGEVVITFKNGHVDEVSSTMREKPRQG